MNWPENHIHYCDFLGLSLVFVFVFVLPYPHLYKQLRKKKKQLSLTISLVDHLFPAGDYVTPGHTVHDPPLKS